MLETKAGKAPAFVLFNTALTCINLEHSNAEVSPQQAQFLEPCSLTPISDPFLVTSHDRIKP